MKKHNLHTHTIFSDGSLSAEAMVQCGLEQGLEILGISDHAFSHKLYHIWQIISLKQYMKLSQDDVKKIIQEYLAHLIFLDKKYDTIKVLKGIEIDVSSRSGIKPALLPFTLLNQCDYVLFEYVYDLHRDEATMRRSIDEIISIRNKIHPPVGLAHNDIQLNWNGQERDIAELLSNNNIYVELNTNPRRNLRDNRNYFTFFSDCLLDAFKEYEVTFVIGTDCHKGENLADTDDAQAFINDNGLKIHPMVQ